MKKQIICAISLLLCTVFVGCSNDDDTIIYPTSFVDSSVSEFFETEWPTQSMQPGFFYSNSRGTVYNLINSKKQLQSIYNGEKELPAIDFTACTLLIGQVQVPHSGHSIQKIDLVQTENGLVANIYLKVSDSGYQVITELRFWRLYPKLASTDITINVIKSK